MQRPHLRGGEDVGAPSVVLRPFSGVREQARPRMPLAQRPVEGYPVGRCTSRIRASTSNCSLRFSSQPHFPFGNCPLIVRTSAFRQSARRIAPTSLFPRLFQLPQRPRFPFWELTPISVHRYDSRFRPFPLIASKGRTRESPRKGHGVQPLGFPHSKAARPAVTAQHGIARTRRRDR